MTRLARDITGSIVQAVGWGASQTRAFTGTSAQSAVMGDNTYVVRLTASADCFVAIGANPTATTSSTFLPAGVVEYVEIFPGQRVAAIQASSAGTLYITETI